MTSGMVRGEPAEFVNPVPHVSFVHGQEQVDFLRARFEALRGHHFFETMAFSTDRETIAGWAPLLIEGRDPKVPVAATRVMAGTDVNFGSVSRKLLAWLNAQPGGAVETGQRVVALRRADGSAGEEGKGPWELDIRDIASGGWRTVSAGFVFVGAGGGSLPLLQKAGITEARGLGGFPVGGQWLVCDREDVVGRHQAKVYGQALGAAPTMAVPHLDTRILDGKKSLLFGPFAAWTTKFLHGQGHWTDLPRSVRPDNVLTLLRIAAGNVDLIRYLIKEGTQSMADRVALLRQFYPEAREEDWHLADAGIRVQAIKKTDGQAGIVHYGTEILHSADRSIAALLGASPGASVCVNIAMGVIQSCLPQLLATEDGRARMKAMIPSWDEDLKLPENSDRFRDLHRLSLQALGLG
jgi:malate dehydrogenase (quinone)